MDLREFVAQTLVQIVEGVSEAQSAIKGKAAVNPPFAGDVKNLPKGGIYHTGSGELAQFVEFDVALTVKEETGAKGGISVLGGVVNLGGAGQLTDTNVSVSRVRTTAPFASSK